jgi:hypothetical protein
MRVRAHPGSRCLAVLALAAGLAAGSCAPHLVAVPSVPAGARESAYLAGLGRREAAGRAVDAELTVWARPARPGHWPAVTAGLALASPDLVRLRIDSLFGTALDGAARGDSVVALLPARRIGVAADATRDPLGVRRPGSLGYRIFAAAWRPPDPAWEVVTWSGDLIELRWAEAGDSLRLTIGPDGHPAGATLAAGDSLWVAVRYRAWMHQNGVDWPSLIEFSGADGEVMVRCRVERALFRDHAAAGRLVVRLPAGTDLLDWPAFVRTLQRAREL